MTTTQLFAQVNSSFRGSDDDAPTSGTDFDLWLATTNRKINEWARDSKHTWESQFSIDTLSPVVAAGTQTYNLPLTILEPSDRVTVTLGDKTFYFNLCKPQERDQFKDAVYLSGSNPQVLTFVDPITASSPIVGGTITVGGYHIPADVTTGASVVPVDDPYWLVYAVASELAFNDITYSDKAPDLNAKANNLYTQMVHNNYRGTYNNPRTARTKVDRILSPRTETSVGSL